MIDAQVTPGEIVFTNYGAQLYNVNPETCDDFYADLWKDDKRLICNMQADVAAIVLGVPISDSGNPSLFVMTFSPVKFGWVTRHDIRKQEAMHEIKE